MIAYFIERKDTHEWLFFSISPKVSYSYSGEPFEDFPNIEHGWTKDPIKAFPINSKQLAIDFLRTADYFNEVAAADCEVTEHEFI